MKGSLSLLILIAIIGCSQRDKKTTHAHTNALIGETSPYLLQHAHNPVAWEPWGDEVLQRAQQENKLLIISIGYAACHWCHVMEDECFEDAEVAALMNRYFISIKIDREERPDVDQIYMDALQMMTGGGGWPLNIVALPDGRPFWGGTYLPKEEWLQTLNKLLGLYENDPTKVVGYAQHLEDGIKAVNLVEVNTKEGPFGQNDLDATVIEWSQHFDTYLGGYKKAPKFMMPNNLDFLLHYGISSGKDSILDYVNTTLTRMAYGGIFDPIEGGFSRYSVDAKWHIPHFEKMLYDNGQLVSLYAKAYAVSGNPLYKEVVEKTIAFVEANLRDGQGGFHSSIDADSYNGKGELEEGAYYVWTEKELDAVLGAEAPLFKTYYNINPYGHWEEDKYVLIRDKPDSEIAVSLSISERELATKIAAALDQLKMAKKNRSKPRLDDKILTSWNGLMLKGLVDAYRYLQNDRYLELALANAEFLQRELLKNDGTLYRNHKNGKSTINAFLDDYATVIDAFIGLYELTFDPQWLQLAQKLTHTVSTHFKDSQTGLFYYTSSQDADLLRRSIEINDNVIPSSNSMMAVNLLKLHKLFPDKGYGEQVEQMIQNVHPNFLENGPGFANWLHVVLFLNNPFYEIAIVGKDYKALGKEMAARYRPNSIIAGTEGNGALELFQNRYSEGNTLIYICIEGSCKLPVTSAEAAFRQF